MALLLPVKKLKLATGATRQIVCIVHHSKCQAQNDETGLGRVKTHY
jgi:hypothetical protein